MNVWHPLFSAYANVFGGFFALERLAWQWIINHNQTWIPLTICQYFHPWHREETIEMDSWKKCNELIILPRAQFLLCHMCNDSRCINKKIKTGIMSTYTLSWSLQHLNCSLLFYLHSYPPKASAPTSVRICRHEQNPKGSQTQLNQVKLVYWTLNSAIHKIEVHSEVGNWLREMDRISWRRWKAADKEQAQWAQGTRKWAINTGVTGNLWIYEVVTAEG